MTPGTKAPHGIVVSIVSNAANMGNKAFQPNLINIKIGNTVVWINDDIVIHTVTSGSGPNDLNYGKQFNSGFLVEGQSITHTFKTAGRFNYLCQVHPLMVGQVIVE
jgi:plastocyanin